MCRQSHLFAGQLVFNIQTLLLTERADYLRTLTMHESHGELLLGGTRLHNVHVELEQEEPLAGRGDWMLSGRLRVTQQEAQELELERHYLLQLEDGRAGPIVVTRLEPHNGELRAAFIPHPDS